MQFTSLAGLTFVVCAAILCRIAPVRLKPTLLLAASYLFYCTWDTWVALDLLLVTTVCYCVALGIQRLRSSSAGTALLAAAVTALILYISFFKIRAVSETAGFIAVPLGVSYYTFRLISYVVDVHWGKIEAERNWIRFAAYVAFFPHLIAGPIQRAEDFLPQVRPERLRWQSQTFRGVTRMLLGLFKKLAIADPLSGLVSFGVAHAGLGTSLPSAMAVYLFPLQLYMDFSALTDIAIGVGLLFGIESPENFNRPFAAANITEFWRRWHMTLTGWLRDYVFVPMQMALRNWRRVGLIFSLTVNMVLVAIWHGFRMSFLVFGLIHSVYVIIDALSAPTRRSLYKRYPAAARIASVVGPVFTYHLVAFAAVFFRAPTLAGGGRILAGLTVGLGDLVGSIADATKPPNHNAWAALSFAVIVLIMESLVERWHGRGAELRPRWLRWSAYAAATVTSIFVLLALLAGGRESSPFVYAQF
jgi:alginate O-acetyltransferase complex protein AlgI